MPRDNECASSRVYGRGFVVSAGYERYIITAAHCLPRSRYPSPHLANSTVELTFPKIISPLGSKRREHMIWAELCVLSLADDVAVFAEPDGQVLCDEHDRYEAVTEQAMRVGRSPVAHPPHEWIVEHETPAWFLSFDGEWQSCTVHNGGRFLEISDGADCIKSGMSGEPIIDVNGAAIGLMSTSGSGGVNMHPSLTDCLPPWLLRKLAVRAKPCDSQAKVENRDPPQGPLVRRK
jgi:hypothetical protein